MNLKLLLITH